MPPSARCADACAASSGPLASLPTLARALPRAGRETGPAPLYDAARHQAACAKAWPPRCMTWPRAAGARMRASLVPGAAIPPARLPPGRGPASSLAGRPACASDAPCACALMPGRGASGPARGPEARLAWPLRFRRPGGASAAWLAAARAAQFAPARRTCGAWQAGLMLGPLPALPPLGRAGGATAAWGRRRLTWPPLTGRIGQAHAGGFVWLGAASATGAACVTARACRRRP